MSKTTPKQVEKLAKVFARKRFVFTDDLVDYNQEMYVAFKAGYAAATPSAPGQEEWEEFWVEAWQLMRMEENKMDYNIKLLQEKYILTKK